MLLDFVAKITLPAQKQYYHISDPRWKHWYFKPSNELFPYEYLFPTAWLRRFREFRFKRGPYPGPIDFTVLDNDSIREEVITASTNFDTKNFALVREAYFRELADHFGIIGTPVIRVHGEYNMSADPLDMNLYDYCFQAAPNSYSVKNRINLYKKIKKRGISLETLKKSFPQPVLKEVLKSIGA